jgi:hypothetical protein
LADTEATPDDESDWEEAIARLSSPPVRAIAFQGHRQSDVLPPVEVEGAAGGGILRQFDRLDE